ncbi:hypothetical protein CIL05_05695 [Virgibacillus profundi]|uniref:Alpha/beta hydrolase n=1 Tax=Virgibacillus profundi TaxID=2024555 RepID=A0A2A2IHK1_9BACI|nr:alpha/beta fold hydrolase [Virgibacillus profundi]PAV30595.1 hypothetical protein CIL05_05695 [Virgibacillus profundi]PXY54767.1 alpha/beta hydrolase [Virgibacillus profundi]
MKKKHIISVTTSCMILVGIIAVFYMPNKAKSEFYTGQPTVFVHGYKGTSNSFGYMLNRFENKYNWGNKALVYHVSSTGKIRQYNLNKGKEAPTFVQVIFENNRASFKDSTKWLASVLKHMKENYFIDSVNLVGHSMGGLVSFKYLTDYNGVEYPNVNKLITIGSPFDGIYSTEYFYVHRDAGAMDLKPDSAALQLLRKNPFPKDVDVLSIGSTGDTVAVPESVQTLRTIIPRNQLQEIMIENEKLGHSALHENKHVDKLIHSFLWQDEED